MKSPDAVTSYRSLWGRSVLTTALFALVIFTGCFAPSEADTEAPAPAAILPLLPGHLNAEISADLPENGWALWLWQMVTQDDGEALSGAYTSGRLNAIGSDDTPYWTAVYSIYGQRDPDSGHAVWISEHADPRIRYGTHDDILLGVEDAANWDEPPFMGILAVAERPTNLTMVVGTVRSNEVQPLPPIATGGNASFLFADVAPSPSDPPVEVALDHGPGFIGGIVAVDRTTRMQVDAVRATATIDLADGSVRERTWGNYVPSFGPPVTLQCNDQTSVPNERCREVVPCCGLEALVKSCQPSGRTTLETDLEPPNAWLDIVPGLVHVPFDYCPLVGADAQTPHPCIDMRTDCIGDPHAR